MNLKEFMTMYAEVVAMFNKLELKEHATPENVREITIHLLSTKEPEPESYRKNVEAKLPAAYTPWTTEQDAQLVEDYKSNPSIATLAEKYQRTAGAIRSRLEKLGALQPSTSSFLSKPV